MRPLIAFVLFAAACSSMPVAEPMLVEVRPDMATAADLARVEMVADLATLPDLVEVVDLSPARPDLVRNPTCHPDKAIYPACYSDADCGGEPCHGAVPCAWGNEPWRNGQCCARAGASCGVVFECCPGLVCFVVKGACE